jgi:hypothetical protein
VGEFVAGILERMKLRGVAVTETETEEGDIIITLDGKAIVALSDREPRFAAALSHLAHRAAEVLRRRGGSGGRHRGARAATRSARAPGRDDRRDGNRTAVRESRRSDERDVDEVASSAWRARRLRS